MTQTRPFSFHHTIVPSCAELVLYLHWHSEIEFLYIERGETIFCIEEQKYHLRAGNAIFIPPNLLHMAKALNESACEFYAIVFSPSFLLNSYTDANSAKYVLPIMHNSLRCPLHLTPDISWHKNILNDLRSIYNLSLVDLNQCELQIHGMLLIMWQWLYNNHLSKIEFPKNFARLTCQLDEAINYIHTSYEEEIILSHLAQISFLSEGQFCRLFKQLTGFTSFCYINRYRILKSCEYLSQTSKKVAEIATLCGFNNISYYNREFYKIMKTTPSAYRKEIQ